MISTKAHGVIDYAAAVAFAAVPRLLGWRPELTRAMDAAATGSAVYSLGTDYELGAVPVLNMRQHLAVDAVLGLGFLTAAALLRQEDATVRLPLLAFGVVALTAATLTETA